MGIRRWLRNWLDEGSQSEPIRERDYAITLSSSAQPSSQRLEAQDRVIRLNIYTASGGRIVETHKYDPAKDRVYNNLYIITSDQEFGRELDKILTMESLRG